MKFRKKPVVIEAITFEELVAHGLQHSEGGVYNGMPWSFKYCGHPITHHDDDTYIIPTLEGTMFFKRGEMLITGVKGEIYPCKADIFAATYEAVPADEALDSIPRAKPMSIGKLAIVAGLMSLLGCASSVHQIEGSSDGDIPQARTVCKDGHCWRTKDTGQYIGTEGELLPPPKE
jgi:hypothetical protein